MELNQMLPIAAKQKTNAQKVHKLLTEISRLDNSRIENLSLIKSRLDKIKLISSQIVNNENYGQRLMEWVDQYSTITEKAASESLNRFGADLEKELRNFGLSLSGQYPELKAGVFLIEMDSKKDKVTLWYGAKQEKIQQLPLLASRVASDISNIMHRLGSRLDEQQILQKLREAYCRTVEGETGEPAPIIAVLSEMAYLLQSPRFFQDPKKENYQSYDRVSFSYDLFRLRQFQAKENIIAKLKLTVATRAYSKKRSDFLWVPDDEQGKGTIYSFLSFKEGESDEPSRFSSC